MSVPRRPWWETKKGSTSALIRIERLDRCHRARPPHLTRWGHTFNDATRGEISESGDGAPLQRRGRSRLGPAASLARVGWLKVLDVSGAAEKWIDAIQPAI